MKEFSHLKVKLFESHLHSCARNQAASMKILIFLALLITSSTAVEVKCKFSEDYWHWKGREGYVCEVQSIEFLDDSKEVLEVLGNHLQGKSQIFLILKINF